MYLLISLDTVNVWKHWYENMQFDIGINVTFSGIRQGKLSLELCCPESVMDVLQEVTVGCVVLDEVHVFHTWYVLINSLTINYCRQSLTSLDSNV